MSSINLCVMCGEEFYYAELHYYERGDGYYCDCCIGEAREEEE